MLSDINKVENLFSFLDGQTRRYSASDLERDFKSLFLGQKLRVETLFVEVRKPEGKPDQIPAFVHLYEPLSKKELFYPNILLSKPLREIARVFQLSPILKKDKLYWNLTVPIQDPPKEYPYGVEFITMEIATTELIELINRDWDPNFIRELGSKETPYGEDRSIYVGFPITKRNSKAGKLIRDRYGSLKRFFSLLHLSSVVGAGKYMFDIDIALFNPEGIPVPLGFIEYKHGREEKILSLNEKIGYEILSKHVPCYLVRGVESFSIFELSGDLRSVRDYSDLNLLVEVPKERIVNKVLSLVSAVK